jgi:hypothetical protein
VTCFYFSSSKSLLNSVPVEWKPFETTLLWDGKLSGPLTSWSRKVWWLWTKGAIQERLQVCWDYKNSDILRESRHTHAPKWHSWTNVEEVFCFCAYPLATFWDHYLTCKGWTKSEASIIHAPGIKFSTELTFSTAKKYNTCLVWLGGTQSAQFHCTWKVVLVTHVFCIVQGSSMLVLLWSRKILGYFNLREAVHIRF